MTSLLRPFGGSLPRGVATYFQQECSFRSFTVSVRREKGPPVQNFDENTFSPTAKNTSGSNLSRPRRTVEDFRVLFKDDQNQHSTSTGVLSALQSQRMRDLDSQSEQKSVLNDPFASNIVSQFEALKSPAFSNEKLLPDWMSRVPMEYLACHRSLLFDKCLVRYMKSIASLSSDTPIDDKNDDEQSCLNIVEIGVGFDFRLERILENKALDLGDNGFYKKIRSFEIDSSEVMDVRERIIDCNMIQFDYEKDTNGIHIERKFYRKSIYDSVWMKQLASEIDTSKTPLMIVCEALFPLLAPHEMESAVARLRKHFGGALLLFDCDLDLVFHPEEQLKLEILQQVCLAEVPEIQQTFPFWFNTLFSRHSKELYNVNLIRL